MTIHEYLMEARQDDTRWAREPVRLPLEARQACKTRRHRTGPAALARRPARLMFRRATTQGIASPCVGHSSAGQYRPISGPARRRRTP
jgi:hypothetical protein